jgi:ribonucleoside-diphosphate reductase alpha chain
MQVYGAWWELNEQRGRATILLFLERDKITEAERALWLRIENSGSGEPGTYWTNNIDWGTNPCCEIALRPFTVL